jgi:sugar-specific transcriptional regulator TrmB
MNPDRYIFDGPMAGGGYIPGGGTMKDRAGHRRRPGGRPRARAFTRGPANNPQGFSPNIIRHFNVDTTPGGPGGGHKLYYPSRQVVVIITTMKPISSNLIESLKTLGLTEYEAKVYSALVLFDRAEVKQIYEYLDAPKPSVYQSLKTLTDKGLVQVVNAKPAVYRAIPPVIALNHMTEVHRKAEEASLRELEELAMSRMEPEENPEIIWTLYGAENVEHSIEELFQSATESLKLVLPREYYHYLEMLRDKDISIELITFDPDTSFVSEYGLRNVAVHDARNVDLSDFIDLLKHIRNPPMSPENLPRLIVVMADDNNMLYIPPFPSKTMSGIITRNPFFCSLVNMVYGIFIEHTPILYPA